MSRGVLTGDDARLPFALLFSLRSHFGRSRALSVFTIIAIAASVALATALEMSTRSVQMEVERTADALFGAAQLEVASGGMGIPEELLDTVAETPGVLAASPLIDATFRLEGGLLHGQALHVLGVDFLSDRKVRGYEVTERDLEVGDPLRLLTQINAVIITKELADRLGLNEGDTLPVRWSGRALELVIRALLLPGGVADAYGGQVAAMDIYSLQELLGRRGWIDRVDVVANDGTAVDELRGEIQARVAGRAQVRRSASRSEYADRVFGTVSLGVWIVAIIGALVAVFLSYSTMSISVDRRIRELALLQSAGLEGRRVRRLVRTDALVLSVLGTVLGLASGLAISRFFFSVFSGLTGVVRNIEVASLQVTGSTVVVAVTVGVVVGVLASLGPSHRATSKPPLEVLRSRRRPSALGASSSWRTIALVVPAIGLAGSWMARGYAPALLAFSVFAVSALALMVVGVVIWLHPILARTQPGLECALPGLGSFAGTSLLARPTQTAFTTGAIAAVVAGLSGILTVLHSIEVTIREWIGTQYQGAIVISAAEPMEQTLSEEFVPPSVVSIVRASPKVEAVGESFNFRSLFRGEEVFIVNRTMDLMFERGRTPIVDSDVESVVKAMVRGEVAVSEAFASYFGFEVGESVLLDTAVGPVEFRIAGLVRDFVSQTGTIHLDVRTFDRYWKRPGATAVVFWPTGEVDDAISSIRSEVAEDQLLFFSRSADAAKFITTSLDGFFNLIYALGSLTSGLGALAVLNVMFGAVFERRREFGLIQSAGATRWQLTIIMSCDALLMVAAGVAVGIVAGVALSDLMLAVVSESLGWTLTWLIAWKQLVTIVLMAVGASSLAAAYAGLSVRSIRGVEVLG